jgi:hypothetical protein
MSARKSAAPPDVSARLSALHARVDAMKTQQAAVTQELTGLGASRHVLNRELKQQRAFHRQMAAVDVGYADAVGDAENGEDFVLFTDGGRQRSSVLQDDASARSLAHALDDLRSHSELMTSVLVNLAHSNETNRANLLQVQSMTRAVRDAQALSSSSRAAAARRTQATLSSLVTSASLSSQSPPLPPAVLNSSPFGGAASLQVSSPSHPNRNRRFKQSGFSGSSHVFSWRLTSVVSVSVACVSAR